MIKAYYVGKLTLIADLNHWNQLICQCWIESMVNSVCHSDRLDGKKPSKSEGGAEWCQLCLEVVKSYQEWLTADTKNDRDRRKIRSEEQNQKPQPLMWVIAQKFGSQKTCTSCCFSNAEMVSFMEQHWQNLSKRMWNRVVIKSESWPTWLNREMWCISTLEKWALHWIRH